MSKKNIFQMVSGGTHIGMPPLSRHDCTTCKAETLHKYTKCIHCGTEVPLPKSSVRESKINMRLLPPIYTSYAT